MKNNDFHYYYRDGHEIFYGDWVERDHRKGYIQEVFAPDSPSAIFNDMPRGGFVIYFFDDHIETVLEFDHPDVLDPGHVDCGLTFKCRATIWFHIHYFWRQVKFWLSIRRIKWYIRRRCCAFMWFLRRNWERFFMRDVRNPENDETENRDESK